MDDRTLDGIARHLLAEVRSIPDRARRVVRTTTLIDGLQDIGDELSRLRREDLLDWAKDTKQVRIAEQVGFSQQRVSQLLNKGPKPSRALLGGPGGILIAVGGEHEAGMDFPGDGISAEASSAYEELHALAHSYGAQAELEIVPQPGFIDLNRDNLIVLTSPQLLPIVGQVLPSDPRLRFRNDDDGWYLTDLSTSTDFRPPTGPDAGLDYAYLGRLPRPDQNGTFLYMAGVHALGTLGAALFFAQHTDEIYRTVKDRRWSTIIECQYDPSSRQITTTRRATPIYKHEGTAA